MRTRSAVLAGSVVSGVLASACCLGPLVLAVLGISGAAFAQRFEPLRPYLLVMTYGLLGGAFYLTYRPAKEECGPGEDPAKTTAEKIAESVSKTGFKASVKKPAEDKGAGSASREPAGASSQAAKCGASCQRDCCKTGRGAAAPVEGEARGLVSLAKDRVSLLWRNDYASPPFEGSLTEELHKLVPGATRTPAVR